MSIGASKETEIRTLMNNIGNMTSVVGVEMGKLASLLSLKATSVVNDTDADTILAEVKTNLDAAVDTLDGILGVD